jgi:hypothetical protein
MIQINFFLLYIYRKMPVVQNTYDVKMPRASQDGIHYPAYQTVSITSSPSVFQVPIQPPASASALNSRNTIIFDLETSEVSSIEDHYFRWKVRNSGSSTIDLAPIFDWFDYTLVEESKGVGAEISRVYPITSYVWLMAMLNEEERQNMAYRAGVKLIPEKDGQTSVQRDIQNSRLHPGESREYWIQIPVAYLNMGAIDMRHIINDIRFKFQVSSVSNIVLSGTSSDLVVDDISLVINSRNELPFDAANTLGEHQKHEHGYIFVDT